MGSNVVTDEPGSSGLEPSLRTSGWRWLPLLFLALYALESVWLSRFADVSRDEGWYLYAGNMIRQGYVPYRDFPYFQSPVLPYLYAVIGGAFGITLDVGRVVSVICGLLTASLVAVTAYRLRGPWASILALLGFITSAYGVYHLVYASNLALSTCLSFLAASVLVFDEQRHLRWAVLAVALAVLAACVRLSFLPYAALVLGVSIWRYRDSLRAVLTLTSVGLGVGLSSVGWFLVFCPARLWFDLVVAQAVRRSQYGAVAGQSVSPAWQWWLTSASFFGLSVGLFVVGAVLYVGRPGVWPKRNKRALDFLIASALVVYVPNLIPGDVYPNYLVPALPFMAAA